MINTTRIPIKLACATALTLAMLASSLPGNSQRVTSSGSNTTQEGLSGVAQNKIPDPPREGTPKGNQTPGTTRRDKVCPILEQQELTAIAANNGKDFTLSEYPTFWFYVPYAPQDISRMEFLLLDGTERQTIYKTAVKLTENPGIISVTLPSQPQYALKTGELYHWYLTLSCDPDPRAEPELVVDGWVQRLPMNSQLETRLETVSPKAYIAYQEHEVWYDTIHNLAQLYTANPNNQEFENSWTKLLEDSLDIDWVVQEPFVNSELIPLEE